MGEQWYTESLPGARLAAWWLSLGRSEERVVADLTGAERLDEVTAWTAVEQARSWARTADVTVIAVGVDTVVGVVDLAVA